MVKDDFQLMIRYGDLNDHDQDGGNFVDEDVDEATDEDHNRDTNEGSDRNINEDGGSDGSTPAEESSREWP